MHLQKIKESELAEYGVEGLATRPSLPSLYSGRSLSARELRAAFDRLPRLLAERFNALLDSLGLYEDTDGELPLSALIATDIQDGHSLYDLFCDLKSGAACDYITLDGEESLAKAIARLGGAGILADERGEGDIVTEVDVYKNTVFVKKGLSSADLSKRTETEALKKRLLNIEEALASTVVSYETHSEIESAFPVPHDALHYAAIEELGGEVRVYESENLLSSPFTVSHEPSDPSLFDGMVIESDGELIFLGGTYEVDSLHILLYSGPLKAGLYTLGAMDIPFLVYNITAKAAGRTLLSLRAGAGSESVRFRLAEDADEVTLTVHSENAMIGGSATPSLMRREMVISAPYELLSIGKNLIPNEVYDLSLWTPTNPYNTQFSFMDFSMPRGGTYTIHCRAEEDSIHYFYIENSTDGKNWSLQHLGTSKDGYLLTGSGQFSPFTFTYDENRYYRLWYYYDPPYENFLRLHDIQLEHGDTATEFVPYEESTLALPDVLTSLDGFGLSLPDGRRNTVDFVNWVYAKEADIRPYQTGDEDNPLFYTDGIRTVYPIEREESLLSDEAREGLLVPVYAGGWLCSPDKSSPIYLSLTYEVKILKGDTV